MYTQKTGKFRKYLCINMRILNRFKSEILILEVLVSMEIQNNFKEERFRHPEFLQTLLKEKYSEYINLFLKKTVQKDINEQSY